MSDHNSFEHEPPKDFQSYTEGIGDEPDTSNLNYATGGSLVNPQQAASEESSKLYRVWAEGDVDYAAEEVTPEMLFDHNRTTSREVTPEERERLREVFAGHTVRFQETPPDANIIRPSRSELIEKFMRQVVERPDDTELRDQNHDR